MSRTARKGRFLTPEVRHHGFIYTTFSVGASHTGLTGLRAGPGQKPAWPARRAGLGGPRPVYHCPSGQDFGALESSKT
jgi:hypothetical protein